MGGKVSQASKVLQRIAGSGWIVLSDKLPTFGEEFPELASLLLEHADLSLSPFFISSSDDESPALDRTSSDLEILLDVEVERLSLKEAQYAQTAQSGLFVLSGGDAVDWVNALATSNLGNALREALTDGSLILAADAAAAAMGTWVVEIGRDDPIQGLDWLPGALILPWLDDPIDSELVRSLLTNHEQLYAMGINGGRIVAYGPEGEFQLWGGSSPTVVLGSGWS
jgi:hypothetical protein